MDETIERLVEQVKVLSDTVKAQSESVTILIQRSEQLFRMQEERLNVLPQLAGQLQEVIDEIEVTDQALKESLDDLDGSVDGIKKTTAALLVIQQQQNAKSQENESEG